MAEERAAFTGKLGFVLTAAGAAVGLGCLWRFPYMAPQNGGGLFLLCYVVLLVALGIPLLITEMAIGRKTQSGVLGAFTKLHPKFAFVGGLCLLTFGLVQPYYSILGGEFAKYSFMYVTGQGAALVQEGFYQSYIAQVGEPLLWLAVIIIVTGALSLFGITKGIERVCKILLPLEAIMLVGLMIYCLTLPHAIDGLAYFLMPNFETFGMNTILAAMGQVFYSLSIGFGIMLTCGSFASKKMDLMSSAWTTGFFTLFIAIIASCLIIPASFLFVGGDPSVLGSGTVFSGLPMIFSVMPFGGVIGAVFFIILTMAALTSNLTTLELIVTALQDRFKMSRFMAVLLPTLFTMAAGAVVSLGYGPLSWIQIGGDHLLEICDKILANMLLPAVAICMCILVGYFIAKGTITDEIGLAPQSRPAKMYTFMIKYFCPICIIIIFISNFVKLF